MKCMIIAYNSSRNIESLAKIGSFSYSLFIYLTIKRVTKCSFTTDINCKWKLASWMRQWLIGVLTRNCAFSFHSFAWFDHEKKIFVYVCRRFVALPSPLALFLKPWKSWPFPRKFSSESFLGAFLVVIHADQFSLCLTTYRLGTRRSVNRHIHQLKHDWKNIRKVKYTFSIQITIINITLLVSLLFPLWMSL